MTDGKGKPPAREGRRVGAFFGRHRDWRVDPQRLKDELREGWDPK